MKLTDYLSRLSSSQLKKVAEWIAAELDRRRLDETLEGIEVKEILAKARLASHRKN